MESIFKEINSKLPSWKELNDDEEKILSYVELLLYLIEPKKWKIALSNVIKSDQVKLDKIKEIAKELENGINIWNRLSYQTINSYINLPKTIKKRIKKKERNKESRLSESDAKLSIWKVLGKDVLREVFNIHHIRIDSAKSDRVLSVFGKNITFVKAKQNELLYATFDDNNSTVYFLDILGHKDLYRYHKLLNILDNEKFPKPYLEIGLPDNSNEGFCDSELKTLLCAGGNPLFGINGKVVKPINSIRTSGHTDRTVDYCKSWIASLRSQ